MATNAELEREVETLREEVQKLRRAVVEIANAMHGGGHLNGAQTAAIRKAVG
jgi:hypothetical protein